MTYTLEGTWTDRSGVSGGVSSAASNETNLTSRWAEFLNLARSLAGGSMTVTVTVVD